VVGDRILYLAHIDVLYIRSTKAGVPLARFRFRCADNIDELMVIASNPAEEHGCEGNVVIKIAHGFLGLLVIEGSTGTNIVAV
jgi:hypothetical protein